MTNTYIDASTYKNAATGLTLTNQYGNLARISACSVGATSLTVPATTIALNQYDSLYLFDGPRSEVLQVGPGGAIIGATSIPLQSGTQYAHAGGQAYCTDGVQGSLGQSIFEASRWIEDLCNQSLWSTNYADEILTMPTMRAAWDNRGCLHFRPRHFPITALTSVVVMANQQTSWQYDPAQAIIDSDQQTVDLPPIALTTGGGTPSQIFTGSPWGYAGISRQSNAWITLAYTAGYTEMPWGVVRACTLLTSDGFVQLENPIGATQITQGKRSVTFAERGDLSGDSLLVKQAKQLLAPYVVESF